MHVRGERRTLRRCWQLALTLGTAIKAALVGLRGDLIECLHAPSPRTASALREFVHSVLKRAKVPVRGIGIGCKGIIDAASSRVKSCPGDLLFLEGQRLSDVIAAGDCRLCGNDARTALIEVLWGAFPDLSLCCSAPELAKVVDGTIFMEPAVRPATWVT
jgi:hypothetical protein